MTRANPPWDFGGFGLIRARTRAIRPLLCLASVVLMALSIEGAEPVRPREPVRSREPVKYRRVIFNCDGHSVRVDGNETLDLNKWIRNLFTGLDAKTVDALFWCDGSGGNTALYDSKVLEFHGARIGKPDPWVSKWIRQGDDPPAVVVREAKKRGLDVFYSFRINDIHDMFTPSELPTFKVRHPEWQIGENQSYGYPTALNFAVPAVRELKLRTIEEIFVKYDFDGIEIDFMRGPPFFLPGEELKNTRVLTNFLRRVRKMLDACAEARGRRIELAVRVNETTEACRLDGFDVRTWANEGLIDILILGSGTIEVDVPAFKKLTAGTHVRIYPCLYGWPSKYNPIPAKLARGIAATFWRDQPDGIYLFNWFPHTSANRHQIDLIREIGDPARLRRAEIMYAAERGKPQREYPHNWRRAKLPAKLTTGNRFDIPIEIGQNALANANVTLDVVIRGSAKLRLTFSGNALSSEHVPVDGRVSVGLATKLVRAGRSLVGLTLVEGNAEVTAVELHIRPKN